METLQNSENKARKRRVFLYELCKRGNCSIGIGVFITAFSAITTIIYLYNLKVNLEYSLYHESRSLRTWRNGTDKALWFLDVRLVILVGANVLDFAAGLILIAGVVKKRATIVKISLMMQILFAAFPFNVLIIGMFTKEGYDAADKYKDIIAIIVTVVFIFIERIHFHHLLSINAL